MAAGSDARDAFFGSDLLGHLARLRPDVVLPLSAACRSLRRELRDAATGLRRDAEALGGALAADLTAAPVAMHARLPALWRALAAERKAFLWNAILAVARGRVPRAEVLVQMRGYDASDLRYADGGEPVATPAASTERLPEVLDFARGGGDYEWHARRARHAAGRVARAHRGWLAEIPDLEGVAFCAPGPAYDRGWRFDGRTLRPGDTLVAVDPVGFDASVYVAVPVPYAVAVVAVPLDASAARPSPLSAHYMRAVRQTFSSLHAGLFPRRSRLLVPGGERAVAYAAP